MNRYSQTLTLRISPNTNLYPVGRGELREAVEVELRRARRRPLPVDPLALAAVPVPAPGGPVQVAPAPAAAAASSSARGRPGLRPRRPEEHEQHRDEARDTPTHLCWPVSVRKQESQ